MDRNDWLSGLKKRIGRFLTRRNQCIIFLLTIGVDAAAIYAAAAGSFPEPVNITLYAFAATGLICTCTLWIRAILFFVNMVLLPFTKNNKIASTLITDTRLRTVLFTVPGLGINLIYAVFNGVIGIINHSAWYGSLSAYYILLSLMRFLSVSYAKKVYAGKEIWSNADEDKNCRPENENNLEARSWKVHKNCGIILSMSSIALGGAVFMLVLGEGGKSYPGLMIYAVATYTFCKLGIAISNMIKARKEKSILLMTLRNISYADALVSILSLQTAMFAAFGQDSGAMVPLTNALTGIGVCVMIFALGIYMVRRSKIEINREQTNA